MKRDLAESGARRGRTPTILVRWCKFNFVGAIGIAVQFAALYVLKGILNFNYLAATFIAVEAAWYTTSSGTSSSPGRTGSDTRKATVRSPRGAGR